MPPSARRSSRKTFYSGACSADRRFEESLLLTPFILTISGMHNWDWLWKVNAGVTLVTFAVPPYGWKKRGAACFRGPRAPRTSLRRITCGRRGLDARQGKEPPRRASSSDIEFSLTRTDARSPRAGRTRTRTSRTCGEGGDRAGSRGSGSGGLRTEDIHVWRVEAWPRVLSGRRRAPRGAMTTVNLDVFALYGSRSTFILSTYTL